MMMIRTFIVILVALFEASTGYTVINGDVTIVGLFNIHEPDNNQCGSQTVIESVMNVEAVKWYLQHLNAQGGLPLKIGLEAYETCRAGAIASEIAVDVMSRALMNNSIIGVLGPEFSSEAEIISPILSSVSEDNRLVQVGFSTTATRLLEPEEKYPNFVRVVPNDGLQIESMIQTMIELKWNRIAVLYEDDIYGRDGAMMLKSRAEKDDICVSYVNGIDVQGGVNIQEIKEFLNDIIIGEASRPPIGGIVFFGTTTTARAIFSSLQGQTITPIPIVMLSDGMFLNNNVFKQNGNVLSKAKGSLVLSPPYAEISEFTEHWMSIFTNDANFQTEVDSNPWLIDVYHAIKCFDTDCPFVKLHEGEASSIFAGQPLYVNYAIRAAHALVKSIVLLQKKYCGSEAGMCPNFVSNFQTGEMVTQIKGLSIDLATDFEWRIQEAPPTFTITERGEIMLSDTFWSYELYNFKSIDNSLSEFELIRVGEFKDGNASVQVEQIRDYTTQGDELRWPNFRQAQCSKGSNCVDCLPVDKLHNAMLHIPGDIYVVGLVPVFNSDGNYGCSDIRTISGYQGAESIRFAVGSANTKTGDYDGYFSDLKIGLIVINTCNNQVVVQRKIFELFDNGVMLDNNTTLAVKDKIIGFVGEIGSSISIAAAETLSRLNYVQVSYASTNPTLSDREQYPYFMRVVTPEDVQAKAMVGVLKKLNIDYIQIIYSTGAYGEGGRNKVKENAELNNICVVQEIAFDEHDNENKVYDQLLLHAHAKLVIVFLRSHVVSVVMPVLAKRIEETGQRGEFLFLGSEAWANNLVMLDNDYNLALLGSYTLSVELYRDRQLRAYVQNMKPEPYSENPWSMLYLQAKRHCYFSMSFDKKTFPDNCSHHNDYSSNPDFKLDSWDTPAYVATKSLLIGANEHFRSLCGAKASELCPEFTNSPRGLVNEIRKTKLDLDGSGNTIKVFDENSDGNVGYRIYNIQRDEDDPQKLVYVPVGRYPISGTFTFETERVVYPTGERFVSKCPNEKACLLCQQTKKNQRQDGEESDDGLNVGMVTMGVLLGVALLTIAVLVFILIRQRRLQLADSSIYLNPTTYSSGTGSSDTENKIETASDIPPCRPAETFDNVIQTTDT